MSRFLLDTNIISEPLKLQPNSLILSRIQQYQTAQVNNLTLVTNNVSDYADFHNLKLENWFII